MWMTKHIPTLAATHPFVAIFNWIVLGHYSGFCASEWCQTSQQTYKRITVEDFEFLIEGEIPVPNITMHLSPTVASVRIW